jgi:hypothetical protein
MYKTTGKKKLLGTRQTNNFVQFCEHKRRRVVKSRPRTDPHQFGTLVANSEADDENRNE